MGSYETLTARRIDRADALPFLAKAARYDTSGGLLTMADITHEAVFFALEHGGETVGAYAIKLVEHEKGKVLWVQSCAADVPGVNLTPHLANLVDQQARQLHVNQVAFTTVRRGLMKKLMRCGYEISGVTLRKNLK